MAKDHTFQSRLKRGKKKKSDADLAIEIDEGKRLRRLGIDPDLPAIDAMIMMRKLDEAEAAENKKKKK